MASTAEVATLSAKSKSGTVPGTARPGSDRRALTRAGTRQPGETSRSRRYSDLVLVSLRFTPLSSVWGGCREITFKTWELCHRSLLYSSYPTTLNLMAKCQLVQVGPNNATNNASSSGCHDAFLLRAASQKLLAEVHFFGEMALLENENRTATVVVTSSERVGGWMVRPNPDRVFFQKLMEEGANEVRGNELESRFRAIRLD